MNSFRPKFLFILALLAAPLSVTAIEVNSSINADQVWRRADSPVQVTALIKIDKVAELKIEPGVTVTFSPEAGIIVNGNLIAEGTEAAPITFTSADGDQPGSWGGIYFRNPEAPKAYNEQLQPNGMGSRMVHCIVENGGSLDVEGGSVLGCRASSPLFANTVVRNSMGATGTVRCLNTAEPLFLNCRFEGNRANRGGAIASSIGSKPRLIECYVVNNEASDNGGAAYLSLADFVSIRSVIDGNKAGSDGGAIYAARVSDLTLTDNVFYENRSGSGTNILFVTDRVNAKIKGNSFEPFRNAVNLQNAVIDVDATGNFWGNPSVTDFRELFRDRNDAASEPFVKYLPFLYAPSPSIMTNPTSVGKVILCRTDAYDEEIPRGVAEGAPLRIRLDGTDSNPGYMDEIQVTVVSMMDPEGILVTLRETGPSTGVFTGRATVASKTNQAGYLIGSLEGGSLSVYSVVNPGIKATYNTLTPKPVTETITIRATDDITHLTDHAPQFNWTYYEPVERPQKSFKARVTAADGTVMWSPSETVTDVLSTDYDGVPLEDGESYTFEVTVNSGKLWSDPTTLAFRVNSLPTAPVPTRPAENALVPTRSPQLASGISSDREGDELTYSFELENISGATEKMTTSGIKGASEVVWTPPGPLTENGTYRFHVQSADPFESGAWGEYRLFYINATEEPPAAFDVTSPNNSDVFDLHPTLVWETAVDPDPLSSVTYAVEISKGGNWAQGRRYENISETQFRLPDSLDNKAEYQWRVTSTDNTGRKTVTSQAGKFRVDTTPSIPSVSAPFSGEERKPAEKLSWQASSDPNPEDVLTYEIEVFKNTESPKPLATATGWSNTSIAVNQLIGWESLADNTVYQWRVKARDNHNAVSGFSTAGAFFNNSVNDAPSQPASVTGPEPTITGSTTVNFEWLPGSDADLSDAIPTLVYEIEAAVGSYDGADVRRFKSGAGDTKLTAQLDDNKLWTYRLRTVDDDGATSGWTISKAVLVNFAEDAPTPFVLISPQSSASIAELDSLNFTWGASSDPDWNSSVRYRFELTGPDGKAVTHETTSTEYRHNSTLSNEAGYSWKVIAIDNTGLETVCSSEFAFRTNTTPTTPTRMELPAEILPDGRLTWGASSDPNQYDKVVYTLEISGDENFNAVVVRKEAIPNAGGMIAVTINQLAGWDKLQDDKDYSFRVKAIDNHAFASDWSPVTTFRFNLANDAPTVPGAPFDPTGDRTITERSPVLKWSASTDEDLSDPINSLSYDIRLDADGELVKNAMYEFSTAPGATEFRVPMPLTDNSPWVWAVRAKDDGGGISEWSTAQPFMVNMQEDAPTPPVALKPYNGQSLNVLGPVTFGWMRSMDIDYKSSVTYRVVYGTNQNLDGAAKSDVLKDSSFTVQGPLENTTYYWKIVALDNTGLETPSTVNLFVLDTRPTVPQPAIPSGGVELKPDGRFAWSGSADPNPADKVTYSLQISADAGFGTIASELSGLKETTVAVSALKNKLTDNQHYYWHIKASDNHNIESAWGSAAEFFFNEKNDAPSAFTLAMPANGSNHPQGDVKLIWSSASDPDPGSRITYTLQVARNAGFTDRNQRFTGLSGGECTVPLALIEAGATYYWKVSAEDGLGGITYGSGSDQTPWTFVIEMPPPPTPAPETGTPGQ